MPSPWILASTCKKPNESTIQRGSMNLRHVSISAVRHLQEELHQIEEQAKMETEDAQTYSLGLLRKDLVEECRRRLTFITYMIRDAQDHPDKKLRHRDES
jgi:hypothetical protein